MKLCLFLAAIFLTLAGVNARGYCVFPRSLWQYTEDGTDKTWYTDIEYSDAQQSTWRSRKVVVIRKTEIIIKQEVKVRCSHHLASGADDCLEEDVIMTMLCLSEELDNKFRVQERERGETHFGCIKLVTRHKNVIQIYRAIPSKINQDWLCYDHSLYRQEWPWIAPKLTAWDFCSFQGGFDFTAYEGRTEQEICPEVWRPSRLESECIRGEGLTFFFADKRCSPFNSDKLAVNLRCWASWDDEKYKYILLSDGDNMPRYSLRFPRKANIFDELSGFLYRKPITPDTAEGRPTVDAEYWRLQMLRSEQGVCYDESRKCPEYAREGRCSTLAIHLFANYCKKSCAICEFAPSPRPECHFPDPLQGDWVMFNDRSREEISIEGGTVRFPSLGNFLCKGKHWKDDFFKVFSVYENGCRPRYTCMQLSASDDSATLQFRLSRSDPSDHSFEICKFQDDPEPLGSLIRSVKPKIILPISSMFYGDCGLSGLAQVNVSYNSGSSCSGTMWDINRNTCHSSSTLSINLEACPVPRMTELMCSAFTRLPSGGNFLVTEHPSDVTSPTIDDVADSYLCWKLSSVNTKNTWQNGLLYTRVHCDTTELYEASPSTVGITALQTRKDIENPCGKIGDEPPPDNTNDPPWHPRRKNNKQKTRPKQNASSSNVLETTTNNNISPTVYNGWLHVNPSVHSHRDRNKNAPTKQTNVSRTQFGANVQSDTATSISSFHLRIYYLLCVLFSLTVFDVPTQVC